MNEKEIKKIKTQKNSAILLIFVAIIMFISYLGKKDFNEYIICGALIVLIIISFMGLKNSLRKQKEQNI